MITYDFFFFCFFVFDLIIIFFKNVTNIVTLIQQQNRMLKVLSHRTQLPNKTQCSLHT